MSGKGPDISKLNGVYDSRPIFERMEMSFLVCGGKEKIKSGLGMSNDAFHCMVAQLSHFGWSALVLTWAAILAKQHFYLVWGVWTVLTAVKEFVFDFNVFTWAPGLETNEQSGGPWGDVLDFTFYVIGGLVAYFALRVTGMV